MSTNENGIRLAPHNVEAEEALLGSVLINPEVLDEVVALIKPADFYIHKNGWIWEAFLALREQQMAIDFVTVQEEIERKSRLAEAGGPAYLVALINNTGTSLNAESYARIVAETSARRRILAFLNDMAKRAYAEDQKVDTSLGWGIGELRGILERTGITIGLRPIGEVASDYFDILTELYKQKDGPHIPGVPTGFIDLDKLLGGLQKRDFILLAGRPSVGKTGVMLSIARTAGEAGKRVAFFSLEMANAALVQRTLASITEVDSARLRIGDVYDSEWPQIVQGIVQLSNQPVYLCDRSLITPEQIRTECIRLKSEHGLDLVVIDYLQLMNSGSQFNNRVVEVSYLSRMLKLMAGDLDVPIMAGSQLSRAIEQRADKRPLLSDLRDSGSLEQDADVVIFIHTDPDDLTGNLRELVVSKQRNGPLGSAAVTYNKAHQRFVSAVVDKVNLNSYQSGSNQTKREYNDDD